MEASLPTGKEMSHKAHWPITLLSPPTLNHAHLVHPNCGSCCCRSDPCAAERYSLLEAVSEERFG